ncbi:vacuolar protein sorting-associated protein 13D-like isoform X2 [Stylophora pistillata]|uniref:vacuolar protein sorting-associated protein 13D-like isoform X2 n=1 Tax=Stylophora pistillata TaxID=50429 RepID=UPI000C03B146|nr:vacuolar protein sorting-associated protein 13D-like isoform X2 [Stylophora pistillata]
MLESLAAWVLRTYVGEYVENLNTDQLSIGYGTVDLHNLPLKKTALKGLELPLEVKSGFIGHLQLSIPLRRPKSEPWIVHINKLYLVAGPLKHSEYNEEEEKERERTRKKKRLDALEGQWLAGRNDNSGGFWSGSWWPSLYSSFSTTIVENLQLVISDVHFRYEDATTRESVPFSFGITIEKLSAHSTNENWNPEEIIQNERTIKYKLIELQNMAIYWDTDVTLVGDLPSRDLESALRRMINRNQGKAGFCKHQYILEPTSAQARMKRNSSALPLRSRQMPRFVVDVHVGKIPLSLEEAQYKMLIALMDGFERHFRQRHYLKWRPKRPIRNNAKGWWKFAFTCIMESIKERNIRQTWSFAVKRASDVVKYVNLYSQHLITGSVEPSLKEEQNRIEDELTFEELVVLRSIAQTRAESEISKIQADTKVQDLQKGVPDQVPSASGGGSGGWQGWLTGWYSWYGTDTTDGTAPGAKIETDTSQVFMGEPPTTKEEEEFLGELADSHLSESIFNRDQVFAHLNFRLDTGSFKLVNTKQSNSFSQTTTVLPVVEVEFSDLRWNSEMRPRSSTWEFSMSLGALFVRDKLTTGTLFPALVCPQGRESQKVSLTKKQQATVVKGSVGAMVTSAATLGLNILQDMNDPVFEMKFESLPPASKVGYRLSVTTQPLDVVYNPAVLNHISEFFSHTSMEGAQALHIERQLREVARVRYEELKNQTRAELVQTLDAMMDGSDMGQSKRWDIQLDISAPRFLVPESFQDKKASMVLIDFGHLSFVNTQALNRKKTISEGQDSKPDMEDDSFVTPPSTPPVGEEEEYMSISDSTDALLSGVSNQTIIDKMYERYTLDLSDIQMVVCNVKEDWSEVASKPFLTSDAHVVDKFTISIQLERRLLFTADPQYPAVNLHAKLPSLILHINEHKLQALTKCVKQLSRPKVSNPTPPVTQQRIVASSTPLPHVERIDSSLDDVYYSLYSSSVTIPDMVKDSPTRRIGKSTVDTTLEDKTKELMEESRMLLVQFSIDRVSLGVHSMGCLIAELQVLGVKVCHLKRPYDSVTSFAVHGVHLVDAMQSFGPDYELLLSSCKPHLTNSPGDKTISSSKSEKSFSETVSGAFSVLADMVRPGSKRKWQDSDASFSSETTAVMEEEDLITFEYQHYDADSPSTKNRNGCGVNLVNLTFNKLNIIANQETLAALVQFFNTAYTSGESGASFGEVPAVLEESSTDFYLPQPDDQLSEMTEVTASFKSISVLVIRSIKMNGVKSVRKVAEVSVSEVQLNASLGENQNIEGSLGGLRMTDLTPEGSLHRSVYTCGSLGGGDVSPRDSSYLWSVPEDMLDGPSDRKAFTFTLLIPKKGGQYPVIAIDKGSQGDLDDAEIARNIQLSVRMASAQYTHTHRFLSELLLSAGDYAEYATQFGESLRQAASNVAMGLVSKKRALAEGLDYLSSSFVTTAAQDDRSLGSRQGSIFFEGDSDYLQESCDFVDSVPVKPNKRVYTCITVDSPIVQLPTSSSSTEILVAHLGSITIRNTHLIELVEQESDTGHLTGVEHDIDRLFVEVKDMSLYCTAMDTGRSGRASSSSFSEPFTGPNVVHSPKCSSVHILHKSAFELVIDRRSEDVGALAMGAVCTSLHLKKPTIQISGKVTTPLKLELSTHSYRQLFDTIDNLGGSKETVPIPPPAGMHSSSIASPTSQSPSTLSPSSSASNLEACIPDKVLPEKHVTFIPNLVEENVHDESTAHFESESDDPTPIRALFEVPHLSIKLCGELNKVDHDFVDIMFSDFNLAYEHTRPTVTLFNVSLGGLLVEDLLQEQESPYRYLISSSVPRQRHLKERSLSTCPSSLSLSCPVVSDAGLHSHFSSSVPHCLPTSSRQGPFRSLAPLRPLLKNQKFPSMPSVNATLDSESSVEEEDLGTSNTVIKDKKGSNLVHINVHLIDKNDLEFSTNYNSVNRIIEVDFNSLEANLNLQTWVIVLEFFGIGVPQQPSASQPSSPNPLSPQPNELSDTTNEEQQDTQMEEQTEAEGINTDVKFQVLSLTLTLSKTRYPIAKVNAFGLSTEVNMSDGNFTAKGKLSSLSVTDMSPHGSLYREKFTTFGDEALSFNFHKYGTPDPDLQRENDMSLKLRMSSVQYVHTKRFQTELVVFFQHYLQLQEVLGRMRAASEGNEVSWMIGRGSRVALDVKAGNPVILVPRSAKSSHMLVADLGNLTVNNGFLWEGSPGTLEHSKRRQRASSQGDSGMSSHRDCLLDSMNIELVDMDLFTATRVQENNQQSPSKFSYKSQGLKLLKEKCKLNLIVERNLDWAFSRAVPDFNFSGRLSSLCASLDYSQYCFILGMLGENFGEPLEEFERPSSVIQDPLGKPPEEEEVWTSLRMSIDLVNVSLELLPIQLFDHPEDNLDHAQLPSLARIDFIKSKFEFVSFSDWSKTVDLVSEEVIFEDTRQKGMDLDNSDCCIFTDILLPRKSSASTPEQENSLQFEVHYRDTTRKTLLTFLFNHSRIMLIIDYLLDTYNFIMCRMFKPSTAEGNSMDVSEDDDPAKSYETPPPSASGVATRCEIPAQPQPQKTFEMKVNISGTELVVLENVKTVDTYAVVLKITAVLAWRPHLQSQKWLSCSIQSLEMFSCVFSCEEETALSIIDPTSALVELNNSRRQKGRRNAGLLDITEEQLPSLEINLQGPLTMRVSYNDYKLYLSILDSVSKQLNKAIKSEVNLNPAEEVPDHEFDAMSVKRLQELGFRQADCIRALQVTSGRLEASATWLLENATPIIQAQSSQQQSSAHGWQFAGFEVRAGVVCICLIDDCGDSDVPLIEFSAQNLYFWHDLQSTGDGAAHCTLIVQYYNRNVSDWEPFVEPWKCQVHWQEQRNTPNTTNRFLAKLDAPDRLDVTVTTTLINMIKHTIASWSEDYYRPDPSPVSAVASTEAPSLPSSLPSSRSDSRHESLNQTTSTESPLSSPTVSRPESSASLWSTGSGFPRRRSPFVPFVLRNQTGCVMWFKTVTTTPSKVILTSTGQALPGLPGLESGKMSDWREVSPGGEAPFEFTSGEKLRHRDTHEFNIHQVIVQVEGWASLSPVSVDRVGTFFRQARPQKVVNKSPGGDLQPARVVFDVSLEGRARKVVTVRSALMVKNKMDVPMEIKMQGLTSMQGTLSLPVISPESSVAIPLRCTSWQLYLRPYGKEVGFCSQPIEWRSVLRSYTTMGCARECYPVSTASQSVEKFRFCVAVKREGYPEDVFHPEGIQTSALNAMPQPGHTLTIMYPVMLVNLLPCELNYQVKNTPAKGNLKAGKSVPLYTADPERALDLGISIENFTYCDNIRISRRMSFVEHPIIHVELQDTKRRSLILNVKVSIKPDGSLRVSIYAPYWMINRTGIPLVFKQEGVPHDMAGQFDEHEMARSLTPLLFSFSDREAATRCQMRIGRSYQPGSGKPLWSNPFSLDNSREYTRVHARQGGSRPDKVYDIGIDVRFGQGRYRDTRIVTLATRYQLENRTQHTLAFSQRHFVREQEATNPEGTLTAMPGALVLFHWARTDLDQLLCIRLNDVSHCKWSGGFRIDQDDSFHINMRSLNDCSLFVRVEVVQRGATFHVLFTDASQLPPPFRIDNLSEVPITFYQCGTEDKTKTVLQAKQSVPYSWDEPTLLPELSVGVMGGGSFTRYQMDDLGGGDRLYYYNPIYVVFTHTFASVDGHICGSVHLKPELAEDESCLDMRELVLDVPQGSAVLLRRKEPHKRSQLWRLTGAGQLRHEGSSPPSAKPSSSNGGRVLDIDSLAPPTCGKYVRLVLSKCNPRRAHSQKWSFTEDNRMKCDLPGLYVQPRGGFNGLRDGVDAVLGPANITKEDQIPIEQCISTCKLRPGSGCLGVKILADGPTRVLQITDCLQQVRPSDDEAEKEWMLVERKGGMRQPIVSSLGTERDCSALEVQVRLVGGIGVSVINSVPEELVFINLEQIEVDYLRSSKLETLEGSIGRIQIDNQMFASQLPVLLFPSIPEKGSKEETLSKQPSLRVSASKEPCRLPNVEIFKALDVSLRKMTLQIEELLLLKLLQFFGYVQQDDDIAGANQEEDECLYATQRPTLPSSSGSLKRYYFEHVQLNSTQIKLSVSSAGRLPEDLQSLKSSLGLILVNLEDATVDLESFSRSHPFDTLSSYLDSISKHYTEEIFSQKIAIVGSVDLLGNPMGLLNDVSSGLEGLVKRGNVGGLFVNVAHGVSDSAAKITGSLSDGLWNASMDSKFQESRDAMRAERFSSSKDHFVAGVKGLGMGIVGGLTSIVTQPIEGAHTAGLSGFISGIGKGIVGTVTKPTAGVLDFASGAAAAVRGQATRSSRYLPPKQARLRRNCFGPSGAIPRFSSTHAEGQEIMLKLNEGNFNEKFVLSESVRRDKEDRLKAIVTTEAVYFVRARGTPSPEAIVLLVRFSDLFVCQPIPGDGKDYIELIMKADNSSVPTPSKNPSKRPRVRCDKNVIAQKVAQKINYAKNLYDEVQQTVKVELKEPTSPV